MADDLRHWLRLVEGREAEPSAVIIDSRTVQSTPESGGDAGFDGAKKRPGIDKISKLTNEPFVTQTEMIEVMANLEGTDAAREIVSYANGCKPTDNISVATLQTTIKKGRSGTIRHGLSRRTLGLLGLVALLAVVMLIGLFISSKKARVVSLDCTEVGNAIG